MVDEDPWDDISGSTLFQAAARDGKLDVLKWGAESGFELDKILGESDIADAALNGHLEVVKYLRKVGVSWNEGTCTCAAANGRPFPERDRNQK